eukprot:668276-Pleurochrysis_carterae.AAC.13
MYTHVRGARRCAPAHTLARAQAHVRTVAPNAHASTRSRLEMCKAAAAHAMIEALKPSRMDLTAGRAACATPRPSVTSHPQGAVHRTEAKRAHGPGSDRASSRVRTCAQMAGHTCSYTCDCPCSCQHSTRAANAK